jgi:hypothetical protein
MATQRELDHQYKMRRLQVIQDSIRSAVPILCCLIIGATIYLSIRALAGRYTFADIAFRTVADLKANKPIALIVSYVLTALFGVWGSSERSLRKRYIQKWHPLVEQYQLSQDPKRGSSSLTKKGTTRREDL